MFECSGVYTDHYQLTMGQVYFFKGQHLKPTIFDYFFRRAPFEGSFAIFAGLDSFLKALATFTFDQQALEFLKSQGFHPDFLAYLKDFKFRGKIYACREGELVFPHAPIMRVEGTMLEAQLIETLLLNIINFQTLIATKATRMRIAAGLTTELVDFGFRRAQGLASYHATRAASIGGFNATSHVQAGLDYHIPIVGTMAHSFVQSYPDELSAFRDFAQCWPDRCVLLVDTYHTLHSGIPHAIIVAQEMKARGQALKGIRLDSGDLAYLSKKARYLLDQAGCHDVQIIVSNQLDEMIIKSLREQQAPIDVFGVGTHLATGKPDAALDGVYKLAWCDERPCIKLSENLNKVTLPYRKQVYRVLNHADQFEGADCIALADEASVDTMYHPLEPLKSMTWRGLRSEPLLSLVFDKTPIGAIDSLSELSQYRASRLAQLPEEYQRLHHPHLYKVGLSEALMQGRHALIAQFFKKR